MAYAREGLTRFTDPMRGNRGASISLNRDANTGLVPAGESWPVLFSRTSRLYPRRSIRSDLSDRRRREPGRQPQRLHAGHPDRARADLDGRLRAVDLQLMAFEIRYIGNRGDNEWSSINYNCGTTNGNTCTGIRGENLVANGFLNEFKQAMTNLQANNASGVASRAGSFAYFGQGSGTSPLPIYLAYLNGRTDAGNPAAYGLGANGQRSIPRPLRERGDRGPARRAEPEQRRGGGSGLQPDAPESGSGGWIPANFFIVNPDVNYVNVTDSGAFSKLRAAARARAAACRRASPRT